MKIINPEMLTGGVGVSPLCGDAHPVCPGFDNTGGWPCPRDWGTQPCPRDVVDPCPGRGGGCTDRYIPIDPTSMSNRT